MSLGAPGGRSALGFLGGPVLAPGQRDNAAAGQSLYDNFARKKTAGFWPNCFCDESALTYIFKFDLSQSQIGMSQLKRLH